MGKTGLLNKEISRRQLLIGSAFLGGSAALVGGRMFYEPHAIEIERIELTLPRLRRETVIAFLTDLHFCKERPDNLQHIAELTMDLEPDLILMGGDYIEDRKYSQSLLELADALSADLGCFAVMGNWEHWIEIDPAEMRRSLADVGVGLLVNESRTLGDAGLWLMGADDPSTGSESYNGLAPFPDDHAVLMLAHAPAILRSLSAKRLATDLILCGHTHGGQVRLPLLRPPFLPFGSDGYVSGLYESDGMRMYVSRGVGTSILPIRFMCRPEITRIRLLPG